MSKFEVLSLSINDTKEFAARIASVLEPGDVVILEGDIGSGKTQFSKLCCHALGYKQIVTSPSYTIANIYSLNEFDIVHADFYRIKNEVELLETGLDNYLDKSITLVEWGEKFEDYFDSFLKIKMEFVEDCQSCRKITVTYSGRRWTNTFKTIESFIDIKN